MRRLAQLDKWCSKNLPTNPLLMRSTNRRTNRLRNPSLRRSNHASDKNDGSANDHGCEQTARGVPNCRRWTPSFLRSNHDSNRRWNRRSNYRSTLRWKRHSNLRWNRHSNRHWNRRCSNRRHLSPIQLELAERTRLPLLQRHKLQSSAFDALKSPSFGVGQLLLTERISFVNLPFSQNITTIACNSRTLGSILQ